MSSELLPKSPAIVSSEMILDLMPTPEDVHEARLVDKNDRAAITFAALRLMVDALTQARNLLAAPIIVESDSHLDNRDVGLLDRKSRSEIDAAARQLWQAFPEILDAPLREYSEQHGFDTPDPESVYPFADEIMAAAAESFLGTVYQETLRRFVARYSGNPDKEAYAIQAVHAGPPESAAEFRGRAVLPIAVRAFEKFLAGLVRNEFLSADDPHVIADLPPVPFEVIKAYESNGRAGNLTRWSVDRRVEGFIEDGPDEWLRIFRRWADIDLASLGADWVLVREAVARRALYQRSDAAADIRYLREAPPQVRAATKVGQRIVSDRSYLNSVAYALEMTATILAIRWTAALRPFREEFYPNFVERILLFERAGRWSDAAEIIRVALELYDADADPMSTGMLKINLWYSQQEMGTFDATARHAVEAWDVLDDTYLGIGRALLLRDYRRATRLIAEGINGPEALRRKRDLRNGPLVQRGMKEYPELRAVLMDGGRKAAGRQRGQKKVRRTDRR